VGNSPSFDCNHRRSFVFRHCPAKAQGKYLPVLRQKLARFREEIVSFVEILNG